MPLIKYFQNVICTFHITFFFHLWLKDTRIYLQVFNSRNLRHWNTISAISNELADLHINKNSFAVMNNSLSKCFGYTYSLLNTFLNKQRFFSAQHQCCLTFQWIEPQMLLKCYLLYAIFCIFVSMSMSRSIYVLFTQSVFSLSYSFSLQLII